MKNKLNALVLIFINLIIPFSAMFAHNLWMTLYLFVFSSLLFFLFGKIKRFLKFLMASLCFASGYYLLHYLRLPHTDVLGMTFFIFFHFMPLMMIASLLFYDYYPSEILSSLQLLPIPRQITIALTIALRYIPTFQAEFKLMKRNMAMRGITMSIRHPLQSFAYFISPQLFRAAILAEELTAAGMTKGIEHPSKRSSIYAVSWKLSDSLFLFCFFLGFISIIFIGGRV